MAGNACCQNVRLILQKRVIQQCERNAVTSFHKERQIIYHSLADTYTNENCSKQQRVAFIPRNKSMNRKNPNNKNSPAIRKEI